MPNDPVFVNDESCAATDKPFLVEDTISLDHLPLDVAQQWECHPYVFLKAVVSGVAINTNADDLRITLLEIGNISLICLQLFRSTAGEGQDVEGECDALLAPEIAELNRLSVRVGESEIGRHVADLELCLRGARLLRSAIVDGVAWRLDISGFALRLRCRLTALYPKQRKDKQRS
jgi:hypothetical protein